MHPYEYFGWPRPKLSLATAALDALPACGGDAQKALAAAKLILEADREDKKELAELESKIISARSRLAQLQAATNTPRLFQDLLYDLRTHVEEKAEGKLVVRGLDAVFATPNLSKTLADYLRVRMDRNTPAQDRAPAAEAAAS